MSYLWAKRTDSETCAQTYDPETCDPETCAETCAHTGDLETCDPETCVTMQKERRIWMNARTLSVRLGVTWMSQISQTTVPCKVSVMLLAHMLWYGVTDMPNWLCRRVTTLMVPGKVLSSL